MPSWEWLCIIPGNDQDLFGWRCPSWRAFLQHLKLKTTLACAITRNPSRNTNVWCACSCFNISCGEFLLWEHEATVSRRRSPMELCSRQYLMLVLVLVPAPEFAPIITEGRIILNVISALSHKSKKHLQKIVWKHRWPTSTFAVFIRLDSLFEVEVIWLAAVVDSTTTCCCCCRSSMVSNWRRHGSTDSRLHGTIISSDRFRSAETAFRCRI
jgi:hypothetical protein